MAKTLKDFMLEQNKSDEDVFQEMEMSEHEYNVLKYVNDKGDISVPALVNLILHENDDQVISDECKDELLIRKYINEDCQITDKGKEYLESDTTKERLKKLMK